MQKYILKLSFLFCLITTALSASVDINIPATPDQVRAFRHAFKPQIDEIKAANSIQYDAIAIFKLINDQLCKEIIDASINKELERIDLGTHGLIRIAEAVRLGYGFNRGVCTNLSVNPAEMEVYKASITGIGKFIARDSAKAKLEHVFAPSANSAQIAEHIRISNELMYQALEGSALIAFVYAPKVLFINEPEASLRKNCIDSPGQSINHTGLNTLKSFLVADEIPSAIAELEIKYNFTPLFLVQVGALDENEVSSLLAVYQIVRIDDEPEIQPIEGFVLKFSNSCNSVFKGLVENGDFRAATALRSKLVLNHQKVFDAFLGAGITPEELLAALAAEDNEKRYCQLLSKAALQLAQR